jgi:hypothetical protein
MVKRLKINLIKYYFLYFIKKFLIDYRANLAKLNNLIFSFGIELK